MSHYYKPLILSGDTEKYAPEETLANIVQRRTQFCLSDIYFSVWGTETLVDKILGISIFSLLYVCELEKEDDTTSFVEAFTMIILLLYKKILLYPTATKLPWISYGWPCFAASGRTGQCIW